MSTPSHLLTMGTALGYAQENDLTVSLLVGGIWELHGMVVAKDGHGVVISDGRTTSAMRLESVQAVRFVNRDLVALEGAAS